MSKIELFNDHFQNYKVYGIPKAQLVIADIPYNIGKNAYASNPSWYVDGDNKNGESEKAGKEFFDTDKDFESAKNVPTSDAQLYKQAGNSIVVNVLMAIFGQLSNIDWKPIVYGKWWKTEKQRLLELPLFQIVAG